MATDILMPALSPTMTEGTLARWLKHEGDAVAPGDVIAEIETDKATMEVEAVEEGRLARILVREGTTGVAVNTPIAVLAQEGEELPPAGGSDGGGRLATPEVEHARESGTAAGAAESKPGAQPPRVQASEMVKGAEDGGRLFASPLARRLAHERGIALDTLAGSGPHGRIVRADVERAAEAAAARPAARPAATAPAAPPEAPRPAPAAAAAPPAAPHERMQNSSMRRAIARRLAASMTERPHFYVTVDIELDALLELRAKLNRKSVDASPGAFRLSVNDMLIKAAAIAHRRVPGVAVSYTEDAILRWQNIDISIAVAIPDGLITPIIRDADRKGLAAISNEARDLVARARAGKLKPQEFEGGAFSISNLGMFGVREFTAIINPPQAAILALGAGEKRPVVHGDALAVATVMTATLSSDHRAVDGALAARWMAAFKGIVQDPLELML